MPASSTHSRPTSNRPGNGRPAGDWIDAIAACPWPAHAGARVVARRPLYTPQQRARRDASPWTLVQAILAPLQFLVFLVSLSLVVRYLQTGQGYEIATASIVTKTIMLYTIMITGSVWEKEVFGKWLFAEAFFWEDVFSMLVLALQTLYLWALLAGWDHHTQMYIAIAAYAAYAINATQFLLKLRAARLEGATRMQMPRSPVSGGHAA
jgi:3-vinyl bacteriochlorophyllide hydratase